jgi:hypothetical protein
MSSCWQPRAERGDVGRGVTGQQASQAAAPPRRNNAWDLRRNRRESGETVANDCHQDRLHGRKPRAKVPESAYPPYAAYTGAQSPTVSAPKGDCALLLSQTPRRHKHQDRQASWSRSTDSAAPAYARPVTSGQGFPHPRRRKGASRGGRWRGAHRSPRMRPPLLQPGRRPSRALTPSIPPRRPTRAVFAEPSHNLGAQPRTWRRPSRGSGLISPSAPSMDDCLYALLLGPGFQVLWVWLSPK